MTVHSAPDTFLVNSVIVPLDGSAMSAGVLPYAAVLARAWDAPLHLIAVVQREPRGLTHRSEERAAAASVSRAVSRMPKSSISASKLH